MEKERSVAAFFLIFHNTLLVIPLPHSPYYYYSHCTMSSTSILILMMAPCQAWITTRPTTTTTPRSRARPTRRYGSRQENPMHFRDVDDAVVDSLRLLDRRQALQQSTALMLSAWSLWSESAHATTTTDHSLTHLAVGQGAWQPLSTYHSDTNDDDDDDTLPVAFVSYGTRILLTYDTAVHDWWQYHTTTTNNNNNNRHTTDKDKALWGGLAASLGRTWQAQMRTKESAQTVYDQYVASYPTQATRHINLWFALLPTEYQPRQWQQIKNNNNKDDAIITIPTTTDTAAWTELFHKDLTALLPEPYHVTLVDSQARITPALPESLVGLGSSSLSSSSSPLLTREQPVFGPTVYAALGLAGGIGCALTHATVIPLDVVKTRAQMDTSSSSSLRDGSLSSSNNNLWQQARRSVEQSGWSSLFLGAQATIVGYFWYGISVYPVYTFSKRWLLASDVVTSTINPDAIALLAGAMAAVVASLGLTPLEAARIRAVANPRKYSAPGVVGTLQVLADEQVLYAGLPSLLTRQVVFGSIKFLAFERFAAALTSAWPDTLGSPDASWLVSLSAGALAGAVSATVSQPADSLLTYVSAQKRNGTMSAWQGLQEMWTTEGGPGSLFRGLGSRCVWAGSIIAGQFFLYDIFRTAAGVSTADLTQVWNYQIMNNLS